VRPWAAWIVLGLFVAGAVVEMVVRAQWLVFAVGIMSALGVTIAAFVAAHRSRLGHRRAWMLIGLAMASNCVGDVIFQTIAVVQGDALDYSVADVFYLASYPLLFWGLARIVIETSGTSSRTVLADATTIAIAGGLVIWQLFVVNAGVLDGGSIVSQAIFAAYPMADVLILGAVVGLLFIPYRPRAWLVLLVLFSLAFLAADTLYNVIQTQSLVSALPVSDAIFTVSYGLLAAAAVFTVSTSGHVGSPYRENVLPYARLGLLGIALVGIPILAVVSPVLGFRYHVAVYLVASVVVGILVLGRLIALLRSLADEQRRLRSAETRLVFQANHDALTGLPNRAFLIAELEAALRDSPGTGWALMFVDLDNFKFVNDTLGHHTGDQLLRQASERIRASVRSNTFVARLGGDEFVLLADPVHSGEDALEIANRIIAAFRMPFQVGGETTFTSPSIGIALRENGSDAAGLLRDADIALFQAKAAGRRCARVFDASMRAAAEERSEIETGIRLALERGELDVAYQPRIDIVTGALDSFEALLRWPSNPRVAPARIIEVAEASGLVDEIGEFVLTRALDDLAHRFAPLAPTVRMAVNVSVRQLAAANFVGTVGNAISRHDIDPERVSLEITETFLASEPEMAAATLDGLRSLGVRIEVDDFGVGYSSLARLADFPIDGVKIDRSFIMAIDTDSVAEAMVVAIVALGTAMDVIVTAEGIETTAQAETVRRLGCTLGQGFLFAPPMSADNAVEILTPARTPLGLDSWPTWPHRRSTRAKPSQGTPLER
jgi:diguanylate cyclase (GGDEF)-like protein